MTKIRDQELIHKFGKHLKKLREERGMTQEQLAIAADIPVNQVGRIERGEVNTTISTLFALANGVSANPEVLLKF